MKALALPNERHEQFARLVALGMMLVHAYKQAGFTRGKALTAANRKEASRLAAKPHIHERIEVLRAEAAARYEITTDSLIQDAVQCRDLGIELGQIGAAVQAVKELGILTGLRVERRETRRVSADMISDDELAAIIAAGPPLEGLPAPDVGSNVGISRLVTAHRPGMTMTYERSAVPRIGTEPTRTGTERAASSSSSSAPAADRPEPVPPSGDPPPIEGK